MAIDPEDRRQAATMAVGLANAVSGASLTLLGVLAAVATFISDKYIDLGFFYGAVALSALLFIVSIYLGAHGTAGVLLEGAKGNWDTSADEGKFNTQALVATCGIAALALAVLLGLSAPRSGNDAADRAREVRVVRDLQRLSDDLAAGATTTRQLRRRVARLERRLRARR